MNTYDAKQARILLFGIDDYVNGVSHAGFFCSCQGWISGIIPRSVVLPIASRTILTTFGTATVFVLPAKKIKP
jgi:hypothetical protein